MLETSVDPAIIEAPTGGGHVVSINSVPKRCLISSQRRTARLAIHPITTRMIRIALPGQYQVKQLAAIIASCSRVRTPGPAS